MDYTNIIRNVSEIIPLDEGELNAFTSALDPRRFRKKEFVLRPGDVCRHQTFVSKGCLKIYYTDPDGDDHIVKFAIENWWALDLQSFVTQSTSFYAIQAIEDTETWQIEKAKYDLLFQRIPRFEKFARLQFQNAYILLQQRMAQNLYSTAEQKFDHFREKYPGLELRIPQKEIASYLGITPEFLSMLRRKKVDQPIS